MAVSKSSDHCQVFRSNATARTSLGYSVKGWVGRLVSVGRA